MCGETEPNYESSDNCPYPDNDYGTWDVRSKYIYSKPDTVVYVGM